MYDAAVLYGSDQSGDTMKLSADIIFYRLSREYDAYFAVRQEESCVGRPVFHTKDQPPSGSTVITDGSELADLPGNIIFNEKCLYIVCGDISEKPADFPASLIIINEDITREQLFNKLQEIFDIFETWLDRALMVSYESGSFQDFINCTEAIMYTPVCILDKELHYVAYCQKSIALGLVDLSVDMDNISRDVFDGMVAISDFSESYRIRGPFTTTVATYSGVTQNIFYLNEYQGRFITLCDLDNIPLVRYNFAVFRLVSEYAEKLFSRSGSFMRDDKYSNGLRNLFLDSINGITHPESVWDHAFLENGWERGDRMILCQFRPEPRYDLNTYSKYMGDMISREWKGCICFELNSILIIAVNLDRFESSGYSDFKKQLSYFVRDNLLTAGLSRTFTDFDTVSEAYEQTNIALTLGPGKNPSNWIHDFNSLALDYLLQSCTRQFSPDLVCSEKLLLLRLHDKQKGTQYYETLLTYFKCSFNAVSAAKELYIHRSTFINRMERMNEIAKIDYNDPAELIYITLSFAIFESYRSLHPDE